jgi:hypothetical protein
MFSVLITSLVLGAAPSDAPLASLELGAPQVASAEPGVDTSYTLRTAAEPPPPRASRTVRVISEVLVAGAAGTLTGALGGYLGCLGSLSAKEHCSDGTVAAGALTGFGVAVAAMVPLTGGYFDAGGSVWVTWVGEALGAGAAFAIGQGNSGRLLWVAPPLMLAGAVLGYELSARAVPATPRAGSVGVVSVAPSLGPDGRTGLVVAGRF